MILFSQCIVRKQRDLVMYWCQHPLLPFSIYSVTLLNRSVLFDHGHLSGMVGGM